MQKYTNFIHIIKIFHNWYTAIYWSHSQGVFKQLQCKAVTWRSQLSGDFILFV